MYLTMVVLGSFLLGQAVGEGVVPGLPKQTPPAALQPIPEPDLAPARADPTPQEKSPAALPPVTQPGSEAAAKDPPPPAKPASAPPPPEMVADALELPSKSKLTGRPLPLLTAISSAADRRQQLNVTVAYWQLVEAVARYHFVLDYCDRLGQLPGRPDGAIPLRSARASGEAMLREALVAAVTAQHELAALVLLPPDSPLPLPADRPHVGPYLTHFHELFSVRTPPARARLIDRTLPMRRRVIESRAAAVHAAAAAAAEAIGAYRPGRADLPVVLAALSDHLRQRQAFIAAVSRYNGEIAEYVLAVVGPRTSGSALLRMLITPPEELVRPVAAQEDSSGVRAAVHEAPMPTPARRPLRNVPTPAKRPEENTPTPAKRPADAAATPAARWSPSGPSTVKAPATTALLP